MVNYFCNRCGYNTYHKSNFVNHINRKFICKPKISDVDICEICKIYDINYIDHKISTKSPQNHHKNKKKSTKYPQNHHKNENTSEPLPKKIEQKHCITNMCIYCKKVLARIDSLNRHYKSCKVKKKLDLLELHDNIKIPKDNPTNITNITNITHHTTVNNNIIINNFGNENISYFNENELTKFVKTVPPGLINFIEQIHFNPHHPENNNLKITNKKLPFVQVRKNDKWQYQDKNETINKILSVNFIRLDKHFLSVLDEEISDKDKKIIERFKDNYEQSENYIKHLEKKIELLILNNSNDNLAID